MAYIIRHHKAKQLTNREFYVIRFLPVRLGHVLFKYLVYVRRVADLLPCTTTLSPTPPFRHAKKKKTPPKLNYFTYTAFGHNNSNL
jgi:hypothetical protein